MAADIALKLQIDASMKDLKELEQELIRIGTLFINGGVGGHEAVDSTYMDEMRAKSSERRCKSCFYVTWPRQGLTCCKQSS